MSHLVPYGEPWRLGADEATAIHVPFPASIAGINVAPGSYTLYAIPGQAEWEIVVNAATQRWGVPIDDAVRGRDIGPGTLPAERTEETVELLTFTLERVFSTEASLVIAWENTRVRVPVRAT